jgi:predicted RND superfamily exporter protein/CRP-like cAMP-binding protein
MNSFMLFAARWPKTVLGVLLLISLAAATRLPELQFHVSAEGMMLEQDSARAMYQRSRELFGDDETLLLYVRDPNLLQAARLDSLRQLARQLARLQGVSRITSPFSVQHFRSEEGRVSNAPYLDTAPENAEEEQALVAAILRNPLLDQVLFSRDGRSLSFSIALSADADSDALVNAIDAEIAPLKGSFEQLFLIGSTVVTHSIQQQIKRDQWQILPFSLAVLILTMSLSMGRLNAALIPILTAGISVVWTLAVMALTGTPLNVMTAIVPALLVIIGSTEDIHLLAEYYQGGRSNPRRSLVRMIKVLGMTTLLTFLTTSFGFLSIAASPIQLLQQFGWFASMGLLFNFLVTSLLVPAWLSLFPGRLRPVRSGGGLHVRAALSLLNVARERPRLVVSGILLVVLGSLLFMPRITVNNDPLAYFRDDAEIPVRIDQLERHLAGMQTFSIVLNAQIEGTFTQVRYLEEIQRLQEFLAETGLFDKSLSFADSIGLMHVTMEEEAGDPYLPDLDAYVRDYMKLLSRKDVSNYLTPDKGTARILVRHRISSSQELKAALERVQTWLDEELPAGLNPVITGESVLTQRAADHMAGGQALSLLLMVLVIWGVISAVFINVKAGLLAVIPNLLPVFLLFGVMGLLEIPLNTSTTMVAAIALGISIDDTMHFMVRYHHNSQRRPDPFAALKATVMEEAPPIFTTSLALAAGFSVLAFSQFPPVVHFGLLSALVMLAALLASFLITPILLSRVHLLSLRDMVSLRLSRQVCEHCALFKEMRSWEIKKLVLSGEVRELAPDTRFITQGEEGDEMYVVLEGTVEVWITNDAYAHHSIAHLVGGDVIGEVALISRTPRVANVSTRQPTKLLVLRWDDLKRMSRLYPYLASKLFQNLSNILGSRLAGATGSEFPLHDRSSGALNSTFFHKLLEIEEMRARRHQEMFSWLILELALDPQSPLPPDKPMRDLRDLLIPVLRTADILARVDHHRFALLMPRTDPQGADALYQRVTQRIDEAGLCISLELNHFDPEGDEPARLTDELQV